MNLKAIKQNIRGGGMIFALIAIMIFFTITTGGIFMTPRNLSNLFDQTGYVAVLAFGMTLVLIILQIDLSVGFVAGFIGAIGAMIMMKAPGVPILLVILVMLIIGALVGAYQGTMVAILGVPAFVVTLAGQFIFRGALNRVTEGTGTIIVSSQAFNALGNGFIPDFVDGKFHVLTMLLAAVAAALLILTQVINRKKRAKYGLEDSTIDIFLMKMVFIAAVVVFFGYKLASYNGLSWTIVIVIAVLGIYNFFTQNTVLGRHIYAVGGNPEAAQLSGINVQKITMFCFISMGVLSGLAGVLYTARLQSATTTAGNAFELDAIASSYVGGVSATGGVGKVTGTLIGALVMSSLTNGMNLMNIGISYQYMVRGLVLVLAVLFDVRSRRMKI